MVRIDFNRWTFPRRMEHAVLCTRQLAAVGVVTDKRGNRQMADLITDDPDKFNKRQLDDGREKARQLSSEIAQLVARHMVGQAVELPTQVQANSRPIAVPAVVEVSATLPSPVLWLWVSSDLMSFETRLNDLCARDVLQGDVDRPRIYRRLDLDWYGYLCQRMERARAKALAGEIPQSAWHVTTNRFGLVWRRARTAWSDDELVEASRWVSATYQPPTLPSQVAA